MFSTVQILNHEVVVYAPISFWNKDTHSLPPRNVEIGLEYSACVFLCIELPLLVVLNIFWVCSEWRNIPLGNRFYQPLYTRGSRQMLHSFKR